MEILPYNIQIATLLRGLEEWKRTWIWQMTPQLASLCGTEHVNLFCLGWVAQHSARSSGSVCPPLACSAVLRWHTDSFLSLIICWSRALRRFHHTCWIRLAALANVSKVIILYSQEWDFFRPYGGLALRPNLPSSPSLPSCGLQIRQEIKNSTKVNVKLHLKLCP